MKVKVSIIVPVYNAELYINRCLDSLISQTYDNLEIICVDDGSTDRSLEVLKNYEACDQRIVLIKKANTGVSDSRNVGLKRVTGEYILFVDSDDWLEFDTCERLVKEALDSQSDLVMCGYTREFATHSKVKKIDLPDKVIYEKEEVPTLQRQLFGPLTYELGRPDTLDALGTVWGKLYKASIIKSKELEFTDLKIIGSNEDGLFNIEVFEYLNKVTFINQALYHYWKENETSITSKHNPSLMDQWRILFLKMYQHIEQYNKDDSYKEALQNRRCISLLGLGLNECFIGNKVRLLRKVRRWKSILNDPEIVQAYKSFEIKAFPIHWRLFYSFNQKSLSVPSYFMLHVINYLRKKV